MGDGLNFQMDPALLEELEKQKIMDQIKSGQDMSLPDLKAPNMGVSKADIAGMANAVPQQGMDREALLQQYRDDLMQKIQGSEGRLADAKKDFQESQKAGSGWGAGARKGLAVFGDMLSGMAGKPGASGTTQLMKQFSGERKEGKSAYKDAISQEKGYLSELDNMGKRELTDMTLKEKKMSLDPNSAESDAARKFAREIYGIDLPETTNAIQAKVYMDMYAKKNKLQSVEDWKQKNYEQRERGLQGPTPKELEKREYDYKMKPPTEGQATSAIHTRAMLEGEKTANQQLESGYDPTEWTSQIGETLQKTPFVGPLARMFRTKEGVSYTDAKDGWIGAKLRKESGAAIAADEYLKENRKYFPQSADTPETVQRKKEARKALTEQMAKNAGKALTPEQVAEVDRVYNIQEPTVSSEEASALDWLKENPNHPKAKAVAEKLGLVPGGM